MYVCAQFSYRGQRPQQTHRQPRRPLESYLGGGGGGGGGGDDDGGGGVWWWWWWWCCCCCWCASWCGATSVAHLGFVRTRQVRPSLYKLAFHFVRDGGAAAVVGAHASLTLVLSALVNFVRRSTGWPFHFVRCSPPAVSERRFFLARRLLNYAFAPAPARLLFAATLLTKARFRSNDVTT